MAFGGFDRNLCGRSHPDPKQMWVVLYSVTAGIEQSQGKAASHAALRCPKARAFVCGRGVVTGILVDVALVDRFHQDGTALLANRVA